MIMSRTTDPETSAMGGEDVRIRAGSQQYRFLKQFNKVPVRGHTSAEAANRLDLFRPGVCYWKRISELAAFGYLRAAGTREDPFTGSQQTVYRITDAGKTALASA